jgi:hypothetical protein
VLRRARVEATTMNTLALLNNYFDGKNVYVRNIAYELRFFGFRCAAVGIKQFPLFLETESGTVQTSSDPTCNAVSPDS